MAKKVMIKSVKIKPTPKGAVVKTGVKILTPKKMY